MLPATKDVPLRRRIISSIIAVPVIGALTVGVGFVIIGSAALLSGGGVGRIENHIWDWGNMANWPILLMMIGLWALVLRGLIGLSRRWRRLALAPPPPIDRRGHRLMTTSIIVRVIGAYAGGIALLALPGVDEFVFEGVVFGVVSDVLESIFSGAGLDTVETLALLLSLPVFLAPGIAYAWWLDRRQSPDIGVNFDFRGRGKAFMVALARTLTGAIVGFAFVFPVLIYLDPANSNDIATLFGIAVVFLVLAELIARFFSGRARRHRQNMPKRARASEAFGPPWLKWTGVGTVAASTVLAWVLVLATIPPEQRFGPDGATSIAPDTGPALALADQTGEIRFWENREFGFAETLNIDPTLDGVLDPIVRVSVDPVAKFEGCIAYRRQSGVWHVQITDEVLERLDTRDGFENSGLVVALGDSFLFTQRVQGASRQIIGEVVEAPEQLTRSPTQFSKERPPSSRAQSRTIERRIDISEQHILRLVSCVTGEDITDQVMLQPGQPTALSILSDPVNSGLRTAIIGYANGSVSSFTLNRTAPSQSPMTDSALIVEREPDFAAKAGQPVVGFDQDGRPIQVQTIRANESSG